MGAVFEKGLRYSGPVTGANSDANSCKDLNQFLWSYDLRKLYIYRDPVSVPVPKDVPK
jgi:hypothetical protein